MEVSFCTRSVTLLYEKNELKYHLVWVTHVTGLTGIFSVISPSVGILEILLVDFQCVQTWGKKQTN